MKKNNIKLKKKLKKINLDFKKKRFILRIREN